MYSVYFKKRLSGAKPTFEIRLGYLRQAQVRARRVESLTLSHSTEGLVAGCDLVFDSAELVAGCGL